MNQTTIVPDLADGHIILNHNTDNRWQTRIEAVLTRQVAGREEDEQYSYLSHECRSEDVSEDPFQHEDSEYLGISTWDGNYILGAGSSLFRKNPKFYPRKTDNIHLVTCPPRQATFLNFDDVLDSLQTDCKNGYTNLYVKFEYQIGKSKYKIYTPCRYLNFPNPRKQLKRYLQPICGYVLFEQDDKFYLAYVVAYIEAGATKTIQFRLSEQTNYFSTINGSGWKLRAIRKITHALLFTRGFCRVVNPSNKNVRCQFFHFDSHGK